MRTAFQFPGQGSQQVGMGRPLHEASALARELFERADDLLDMPLTALCLEGPDEALRRTENAQPALFVVGAIACTLLRARGLEPVAVAGHSVGEYVALFAAGALSFDDALRAVRRRGELMRDASARRPGTMAAVIGLPVETVETLCSAAAGAGVVDVAVENGPAQTVIAGDHDAVEFVLDRAEEHPGGTGVPLAVAGAFHSRLMSPASAPMAEVLDSITILPPAFPVIANVTGQVVSTPAEIRSALLAQLCGRVRWSACIRRLASLGAQRLVEVGHGRTLTHLAESLAPGMVLQRAEELLAPPFRDG